MDIAIIGAGIAGISTAYELTQDGHHVTVYEASSAPAEGASFANAGWLSPSLLQPWALPGWSLPLKALRSSPHQLLQASTPWMGKNWRWLRHWQQMESACAAADTSSSTAAQAIHLLDQFSQQLRQDIAATYAIETELQQGHMLLLRNEAELQSLQPKLQLLKDWGIANQTLDAASVRTIEAGLSEESPLAGGIWLPHAETINCRQWTQQLRQITQTQGVQLITQATVQALRPQPVGVQVLIAGQPEPRKHDAAVICTGAEATLGTALGMQLPMGALHGYTVSAPLRDPMCAPRAAALDWSQQMVISRIGQRIRISGGAELGTTSGMHNQDTLARLYQGLRDWYPGAAQLGSPQVHIWRGTRGILPDGVPAVGSSNHPRIWMNLGHGAHGVALAHGCARVVADLVAQRPVPKELQALNPQRFTA